MTVQTAPPPDSATQSPRPNGLRVITLTAENVKRLKAVEITADPHVQIIGGGNAAGKSSVLDAIFLALGGGAAARGTTRPIREGETTASVRLDLGDIVVTRTWTGEKTALKVEAADGARYSSPQAVLDSLVGRLSFDPLEFTNLSARDQLSALMDLVDLDVDLDALADERRVAFEERTALGRQGKSLDGQLAGAGDVEDAPGNEVSVSQLVTEYRAADSAHRSDRAARDTYKDEVDERARITAKFAADLDAADARVEAASEALDTLPTELPDLDLLQKQMDAAEETNRAVRRNAERAVLRDRVKTARAAYATLSATIERVDEAKAKALAAAKFPVEGLSFDSTGVLFNGIPFQQASSAEQIRVSLAMAMSLNPKLRVIRIMDGSLLDPENLALISGMAKDNDYQIWLERVGDADGVGVIIEDGQVQS